MSTPSSSRFDARLSREEKDLLEQAATLAGFKSLSDFILTSAREKALQVLRENQQVLRTQADRNVFFQALSSPTEPADALNKAADRYFRTTPSTLP